MNFIYGKMNFISIMAAPNQRRIFHVARDLIALMGRNLSKISPSRHYPKSGFATNLPQQRITHSYRIVHRRKLCNEEIKWGINASLFLRLSRKGEFRRY